MRRLAVLQRHLVGASEFLLSQPSHTPSHAFRPRSPAKIHERTTRIPVQPTARNPQIHAVDAGTIRRLPIPTSVRRPPPPPSHAVSASASLSLSFVPFPVCSAHRHSGWWTLLVRRGSPLVHTQQSNEFLFNCFISCKGQISSPFEETQVH